MVYKLSEHNQILIALFAIVVLCAGKLFKDYLYRGGYIEGMTVSTETSKRLMRQAQTGNLTNFPVNLTLKVKLKQDLPANGTLTLSWTDSTPNDVATSTTDTDYTASTVQTTPVNLSTSLPSGVSSLTNSVIFTAPSKIDAGTLIEIKVNVIRIYQSGSGNPLGNSTLTFTVTSSVQGESPNRIERSITIFAYDSTLATRASFSPITDIKLALDAIQERLDDTSPTAPNARDKQEYIKTRTALTKLMASTYGTIQAAGQVFDSDALYNAQSTAIEFIKQEKERAASNAKTLKNDNSNKRRMAQVNTYYTKNYEANTEVMKNIIIVSVALIILAVLRKKNLIPESIGTLGVIFILTLGGIVIGKQAFDIIRRNDHDFDKYDWNFNEEELNKKKLLEQNGDPANLSEMGMGMAACYGPGCCADGTSWSSEMGQCLPNVGMVTEGSASWANEILTIKFKVPSGLVIANLGQSIAADTVTITLPSTRDGTALFTQKVAAANLSLSDTASSPNQFNISAPNSNWNGKTPIIVTKATNPVAAANPTANPAVAATEITIKINGMALNAAKAGEISKYLTVKTSKDTNLVRIKITGV